MKLYWHPAMQVMYKVVLVIIGTTTFKKAEFVFGTQRGVCVSFAY
jgi:hypothetical protein